MRRFLIFAVVMFILPAAWLWTGCTKDGPERMAPDMQASVQAPTSTASGEAVFYATDSLTCGEFRCDIAMVSPGPPAGDAGSVHLRDEWATNWLVTAGAGLSNGKYRTREFHIDEISDSLTDGGFLIYVTWTHNSVNYSSTVWPEEFHPYLEHRDDLDACSVETTGREGFSRCGSFPNFLEDVYVRFDDGSGGHCEMYDWVDVRMKVEVEYGSSSGTYTETVDACWYESEWQAQLPVDDYDPMDRVYWRAKISMCDIEGDVWYGDEESFRVPSTGLCLTPAWYGCD